jgi:hypothetical protein
MADKPVTTRLRVLIALGCVVVFFATLGTITTVFGWRANPALGPHSLGEGFVAALLVFGLWAFNISLFFAIFVAIPWAVLHFIRLRSWWTAPLVGFAIAFCLGFAVTMGNGFDHGMQSSAWIGDRATMIDGHLTAYGVSLYGPLAALRAGAGAGTVGAVVGISLWLIAYRRVKRSGSKQDTAPTANV